MICRAGGMVAYVETLNKSVDEKDGKDFPGWKIEKGKTAA